MSKQLPLFTAKYIDKPIEDVTEQANAMLEESGSRERLRRVAINNLPPVYELYHLPHVSPRRRALRIQGVNRQEPRARRAVTLAGGPVWAPAPTGALSTVSPLPPPPGGFGALSLPPPGESRAIVVYAPPPGGVHNAVPSNAIVPSEFPIVTGPPGSLHEYMVLPYESEPPAHAPLGFQMVPIPPTPDELMLAFINHFRGFQLGLSIPRGLPQNEAIGMAIALAEAEAKAKASSLHAGAPALLHGSASGSTASQPRDKDKGKAKLGDFSSEKKAQVQIVLKLVSMFLDILAEDMPTASNPMTKNELFEALERRCEGSTVFTKEQFMAQLQLMNPHIFLDSILRLIKCGRFETRGADVYVEEEDPEK